MQGIRQWLEGLGLGEYADALERNRIDLEIARELNDQDLRELGIEALGHRKRLLKAIAELNVAGAVPDAITREPVSPGAAEGERRQLTVLFCDLVGFTELASRLDPEELQTVIRGYEDTCAACVTRYEGYVFQRLGDGIVAFFGYPLAHEGEADRAIRAGLETIDTLARLAFGAEHLEVRIGIATGLVVVTDKGAVGETMNLASRLQSIAQPGSVVVSERVQRLAAGAFDYQDLGEHTLKGISRPAHAYRILGLSQAPSRFEAAHAQAGLTPLVGREQEIGLLVDHWNSAREGEGQVVLLCGEPGIGKSRILMTLHDRLAAQGTQALRLQCSPYYANSAFYPLIDNLERTLELGRDEPQDSKLDKLEAYIVARCGRPRQDVRFIASMLSIPCETRYGLAAMTPQKYKDETLRVLVDITEALARQRPTVMLFEDLHWADPTTLEVLGLLIERLQRFPMLAVMTYRPEFQPKWTGHGHVTSLNLSKLTRAQSATMVDKLANGKALPRDLLEQIVTKTDGVPLFVEELTRVVLESGDLREAGDRYEYVGTGMGIAIPATLRDSLMARLDRASSMKEVAQVGAAIGREFSYDLIEAVAPRSRTDLDRALTQLTESGLAFRRGTPPDAVYTFKHALVQDAAYDSLLKSRRQELHGKIAAAIEERYPQTRDTEPEILAHHLTEAGSIEAAIPLWHKAGELALQRMAATDAIAHLERGMNLLPQLAAGPMRDSHELELCTVLALAWVTLQGWSSPKVMTNLDRAWQLQKTLKRSDHSLRILWSQWVAQFCDGHVRQSVDWARLMLNEAEESGSVDLRLAGHTAMLSSFYFLGEFASMKQHQQAVLAEYHPVRHWHIADLLTVDPKTYALVYQACAEWMLGYMDRSVAMLDEGIRHARSRGHPFDFAWALQFGAKHLDVYRWEPERCAAKLDEFDRLAHEHHIGFFEHIVSPICRAALLLISDHPREAEAMFRETVPRWAEVGLCIDLPHYRTHHAHSAVLSGQLEVALALLDSVIEQLDRPGWEEVMILAETLRLRGQAYALRGDSDRAEAEYRSSLAVAARQQAKSWELRTSTSLARLWQLQGKGKQAYDLLVPVYNWFTEGFDTRDLKSAKALLNELGSAR